MDQQTLLALIMLTLGKSQPSVSDAQVVVLGKQLASEILALVPPAPPPPPA